MTEEVNVNADMSAAYENRRIYDIHVDDILEDKDQPRKYFDKEALDALKESIKKYGLMQPIVFRLSEKEGKPLIVAGERRVRAIKSILRKAKTAPDDPDQQELLKRFSTIPGLFVSDNHRELSLIENVQRENLNPVELAEGLAKLREEGGYDQDILGSMIGRATSSVSEILSINKLPKEIRDEARQRRDISQWVFVEVAKEKGPKSMAKKWEQLKNSGLTQASYRKKKKEKLAQAQEQKFNFGSSMRAVKTASTQLQKLKGTAIESIPTEKRQELREQLEALRAELEQVLSGF